MSFGGSKDSHRKPALRAGIEPGTGAERLIRGAYESGRERERAWVSGERIECSFTDKSARATRGDE